MLALAFTTAAYTSPTHMTPMQAMERHLDLEVALQLRQSSQRRRMLCCLLIRAGRRAGLHVDAPSL